MNSKLIFNIDQNEATIFVMKVYKTTVSKVWNNFTKSEFLDLWWAPKPWKCKTKDFDFQPNGKWFYTMLGPEGEKHFAIAEFQEITEGRTFSWKDYFADENGNPNTNLPSASWLVGFTGVEEGTKLTINIHFEDTEQMNQLIEMGFEEGFKIALNQLEDVLKS
mgnify:CR=1 FL=1